jgi:cobalt-zinc-cadmium efflux system protein
MGDVLSTLGAVLAGIVIAFTNWNWLDPLVSVLIGALILWNAWGILRQTIHILLESTPASINIDTLVGDLGQVEGVQGVHDLHVWSINENLRVLSAHIVTDDVQISEGALIQKNINELLAHKYNIQHATLQLECSGHGHNNVLYCEIEQHHH